MKRTRPNVKFLVKKYSAEIAAWREPSPRQASWESISRELAGREGLAQDERPTAEGVRVAWIRLQPLATLPILPTNTTVRAVVEPLCKSLADLPTLPTNRPAGAAVAGFSQISAPPADGDIFSSDHKRQMQAALARGNLDDL